MTQIESLETDVMNMLLEGEDPTLAVLRSQFEKCEVTRRETTGVGVFTYFFVPPDAPRLPKKSSFNLGDVGVSSSKLEHGVGFVLFVRDGVLDMLEAHTYDEPWPQDLGDCELSFSSGPNRDLEVVRRSWL